jgi:hypothetical protein
MGYYVMAFIFIIDYFLIKFFEFINPADKIEISHNLNKKFKNKHTLN